MKRIVQIAGLAIWGAYAACNAAEITPLTDAQREFFESRIRPILAQECYECHSTATKQKGGLVLDSRPGWQAGGDSGDTSLGRPDRHGLDPRRRIHDGHRQGR